jgi:large subunit ribosomal protein L5
VGVPRPAAVAGPAAHPRLPRTVAQQFDGRGNYTFGLNEQSMFHEIDQDKTDRVRGMDITVVTTATTDDQGRALLRSLGFPFKES